jgi:alkylation response protein AidB-like acyl-CoA dehydrogenase
MPLAHLPLHRSERRADTPTLQRVRSLLPSLDALPLPGSGATLDRWQGLAALARDDLSVARLAEGHADARAILVELGRADLLADGELWGVWAAEPARLRAERTTDGWRLTGDKRWCSGSAHLDRALVTATTEAGPRLFVVVPDPGWMDPTSWTPMGMAATASETAVLRSVEVPQTAAVGGIEAYVQRPGFGHGGAGVAACWWGGARAVVDALHRASPDAGDHVAAALGTAITSLAAGASLLRWGAARIDDHPDDRADADRTAAILRLGVERAARTVVDEAVAALGASGLCHDPAHSARVADLTVYLSQLSRFRAATGVGRSAAGRPLDLDL